jgi:hypothetical protein
MSATICEKCGETLTFESWPFCPHPVMTTKSVMITRDEIPGGIVLENYGPHPIRFDSHTERRKYMEAHGLREKERFSPLPGTDKDPQGIPNPAGYMDPYTLENARILLERAGQKSVPFDPSSVMTVTSGEMTPEEVRAFNQSE